MGKIKRGGYIFVDWIGDHEPPHVHIYKDGRLVAKWDLKNSKCMEGSVSKKLLKYIKELQEENKI